MADHYLFALLFCSIIAGIYLERYRALWAKRRWLARQGHNERNSKGKSETPITDPAEQLRTVMSANFERRRLLSRSEAQVLYAAEKAANEAKLGWRVMAQVSLGEVLTSPDTRAFAAINSKRVDILIISRQGMPILAIEYQGSGHYQGSAAARDAVKKEALRKGGVRYMEVTPESDLDALPREILRIANIEQAASAQA